MLLLVAVVAVV